MYLRQIAPPASPIITLDEAKRHLRITWDDEDDYILSLIAAAEALLDGDSGILGRAVLSQQWELSLDRFPPCWDNYIGKHERGHFRFPMLGPTAINIQLPPLISVDSVKYDRAEDGEETDLIGFRTLGVGDKAGGFILPAISDWWPSTQEQPRSVRITFTAGYSAVPPGIKHAAMLLISHWNENREAVVSGAAMELPQGVDALLYPHRIWR